MKFVSKPAQLDAVQWDGTAEGQTAVVEFMGGRDDIEVTNRDGHVQLELWVAANDSWLPLTPGEWIARDDHGYYPIKPDVFDRRWRPLDGDLFVGQTIHERDTGDQLPVGSIVEHDGRPYVSGDAVVGRVWNDLFEHSTTLAFPAPATIVWIPEQ